MVDCTNCGHFDEEGGAVIAKLELGDEIVIGPDYGCPKSDQPRTDIIVDVAEHSALTAGGVCLECHDGHGVTLTGRCHEPGSFEVSPEARVILEFLGIA